MSDKTLKTLLGLLAALVVVYAVVALTSRRPSSVGGAGELARTVASVEPAEVRSVEIRRRGETIALERTDDGWTADGYRADTAAIAELWSALDTLAAGELNSTNPANHARLGVAADSAWSIEVRAEAGEPVRLLVGEMGPYPRSAYVRLPAGDEVYLVPGRLRDLVGRTTDEWRDTHILALDTAAVAEVRITRDDAAYALRRGDDGWTVDDQPADSAAVAQLLEQLANLDASGFAPDTATLGEPNRTVTAFSAQGDTLAALRMREEESYNVRLALEGNASVFEISRWRVDRLAPERSRLEPR